MLLNNIIKTSGMIVENLYKLNTSDTSNKELKCTNNCSEYYALDSLPDDKVKEYLININPTAPLISALQCVALSARIKTSIIWEITRRWAILTSEEMNMIEFDLLKSMLTLTNYDHSQPMQRDKPSLENNLASIFITFMNNHQTIEETKFIELFTLIRHELVNGNIYLDMYNIDLVRKNPNINKLVYQTIASVLYANQTVITQKYRFSS